MQRFALLVAELEHTRSPTEQVEAALRYLQDTPHEPDRTWAIALLSGSYRPPRLVPPALLRTWAAEAAGLPLWLLQDTHKAAGDLAETLALTVPTGLHQQAHTLSHWLHWLQALPQLEAAAHRQAVVEAWAQLTQPERYVLNKLLLGGWRLPLRAAQLARALAGYTALPAHAWALALQAGAPGPSGTWPLLLAQVQLHIPAPQPPVLPTPQRLDTAPRQLGSARGWLAMPQLPGMAVQLLATPQLCHLWTADGELVHDLPPHWTALQALSPLHLVGTLVGANEMHPAPAPKRKPRPTGTLCLLVTDVLTYRGTDLRAQPLSKRLAAVQKLVEKAGLDSVQPMPSTRLYKWDSLPLLAQQWGVQALVLRQASGSWYTPPQQGYGWKPEAKVLRAVLMYAQRGNGPRANLYCELALGVWQGDHLVAVARPDHGLPAADELALHHWIRANTTERYGPVRQVEPTQVLEFSYEYASASDRHKSGLQLHGLRLLRWLPEAAPNTVGRLEDIPL